MKRLSIKCISVFCAMILCLTIVVCAAPMALAATVYLRGTFNGWEAPADYAMTADSNKHYLITIHLKKGSYRYKAATEDPIPKFKFNSSLIREFKKTLMPEISPLLK